MGMISKREVSSLSTKEVKNILVFLLKILNKIQKLKVIMAMLVSLKTTSCEM